ncbi:YebC/PmpR family DNA-binding transcriptional regulator [Verrucomicrobiales bacterium]|jgi:YebC/PmpR family DNA-binding regulatory protein|nr:YebC/PmpR family DNA-binding transcriptional regulator [Verrucomicrobiales bacterium]MDC3255495.1 YebC/PmpR family DNA-binding transcriptional regulator [bacterium]NCF90682.1 YebC/PmpR family DNA-binding transcriptional regulator [Verrucomicrobiaceae bacterium]MDA7644053.1 YebC/PmpR family DNA-binding transcriptional regulator [Verrucomicrobiales bacterium]MDB4808499.1 YebC/PmpR family DNA-binding transcriptional regulator [Verrucomicrobiales bacterium]
MGRAFEYRRAAKEKRWDKMSKVFPKLAKSITMAAKDGGPDPESNAKLRTAILNAKAENMPKDNIDSAIKRASGKEADINEMNYEGKGPHGALIFIECASDNTNRTVANLKAYFNKSDGQIVQTGSLEFLFDRKTVIEFKKIEDMEMDEIELELIDAGLEELEVVEENVFVYGGFTSFGTLTSAVEKLGIEVTKASAQRIPNNPQEFTEEQMVDIEKLLDKIEDDEDVQAVYTNIA